MHAVLRLPVQKWFAGHCTHVPASRYQPGSQIHWSLVLPVAARVALGWHAVQEERPVSVWNVFAGQSWQSLLVELPTTVEKDPASQGVQAPP